MAKGRPRFPSFLFRNPKRKNACAFHMSIFKILTPESDGPCNFESGACAQKGAPEGEALSLPVPGECVHFCLGRRGQGQQQRASPKTYGAAREQNSEQKTKIRDQNSGAVTPRH